MSRSRPGGDIFAEVGAKEILRTNFTTFSGVFQRRWMSSFGTTPDVCSILWDKIDPHNTFVDEEETNRGMAAHPRHLLWAILWLRVYETEENLRIMVANPPRLKVSEKTFRKWVKIFVRAISFLEQEVILWDARFMNDLGNDARVSIDGTDMHCELRFNKRFYSHKFNKGGVKYEVGICIRTGHIVWINGPFRCGKPDISVSRQAILYVLKGGEKVEADLGYRGEDLKINTPNDFGNDELEEMKADVRHRHETVNRRLKIFGVLAKRYRNETRDHSRCFRAVAVIVQLNIENGAPLYDVTYDPSSLCQESFYD